MQHDFTLYGPGLDPRVSDAYMCTVRAQAIADFSSSSRSGWKIAWCVGSITISLL